MNTEEEIWKPVPGYTEVFASSHGRIKTRDGRGSHRSKRGGSWIVRTVFSNMRGYQWLKIYGIPKTVHRLVAAAFHPNPNHLKEVNHRNGNKADNNADNLEWCDRSHNVRHAFRIGLNTTLIGEDAGSVKIREVDALSIREALRLRPYGAVSRVAREFKISRRQVVRIADRLSWKHLPAQLTLPF